MALGFPYINHLTPSELQHYAWVDGADSAWAIRALDQARIDMERLRDEAHELGLRIFRLTSVDR